MNGTSPASAGGSTTARRCVSGVARDLVEFQPGDVAGGVAAEAPPDLAANCVHRGRGGRRSGRQWCTDTGAPAAAVVKDHEGGHRVPCGSRAPPAVAVVSCCAPECRCRRKSPCGRRVVVVVPANGRCRRRRRGRCAVCTGSLSVALTAVGWPHRGPPAGVVPVTGERGVGGVVSKTLRDPVVGRLPVLVGSRRRPVPVERLAPSTPRAGVQRGLSTPAPRRPGVAGVPAVRVRSRATYVVLAVIGIGLAKVAVASPWRSHREVTVPRFAPSSSKVPTCVPELPLPL